MAFCPQAARVASCRSAEFRHLLFQRKNVSSVNPSFRRTFDINKPSSICFNAKTNCSSVYLFFLISTTFSLLQFIIFFWLQVDYYFREQVKAHLSEMSKPKEITRLDDFFSLVAGNALYQWYRDYAWACWIKPYKQKIITPNSRTYSRINQSIFLWLFAVCCRERWQYAANLHQEQVRF